MAVLICYVSVQLRPLELNLHFPLTARIILWSGAPFTHEIKELKYLIEKLLTRTDHL
jgi:hypothetical protein